jgi:hypothetical protein
MKRIYEWISLATTPAIVKRAARTAAIVGVLLIAINHGEKILTGQITRFSLLQICLTVTVPYLVSTTSSVATLKAMTRDKSDRRSST